MNSPLAGVQILVTRPAGQSAQLAQLVLDAGGEPVLFPALEIQPLAQSAIVGVLGALPKLDLLIFVSPNAVHAAMPHVLQKVRLADNARIAAIGPGTAAELKKYGVRNIISPQAGFDSESLIGDLTATSLDGSRVLIVRGQGGREFLAQTLRGFGAAVSYLECYRRIKPERDMRELLARQGGAGVKACLATSSGIVENLFEMAGVAGRAWLCGIAFFVPHPRVAATAYACGVRTVFVAGNGNEALVAGAQTWFARLRALYPA